MSTLLAEGADVNGANQAGQTALMLAALMGRINVVPLLLAAGADIRLQDSHGLTALEWSKRRGFSDVTELLAQAKPVTVEPPVHPQSDTEGAAERFKPQELGPATMAVLKTVHAGLEAQRQKASPTEPENVINDAVDIEPQPLSFDSEWLGSELTSPAPIQEKKDNGLESPVTIPPKREDEIQERGLLFAAGFRKIDEEVRARIRQQLPTADLIEPTHTPQEVELQNPIGTSLTAQDVSEPVRREPDAAAVWSAAIDLAPATTAETSSSGATTEPLTLSPTAPLSEPEIAFDEPIQAVEANEVSKDADVPTPTQPLPAVAEAEPITVLSAPKVITANPSPPSAAAVPDSEITRRINSRRLFNIDEPSATNEKSVPVPPPASTHSVARSFLWLLVIATLFGSVYATYLISSRFIKGDGTPIASEAPLPTNAPAGVPTTPTAEKKAGSLSAFTAGPIAGAELNLPNPEYPVQVKNDRVSGAVTVLVRVNHDGGTVISARALNGDRQLRTAAESAAKAATFSPQKLPNDNVVSGTITYEFGSVGARPKSSAGADSPIVGGVLAGAEANIPNAEYPDAVRAKRISSTIMIVVRVNRFGDVIAARPLNGDTQFRTAALKAAKLAKFSKDKLPKEGLVTSGTITYVFKATERNPVATNTPSPATTKTPVAEAAKSADGTPVVGGELAGKQLNVPKPDYPASAKRQGVSGTVTILVRVNKDGRVISWRTLKGDSALRSAALKAARKATFSREKLGDAASTLGTITYNFSL